MKNLLEHAKRELALANKEKEISEVVREVVLNLIGGLENFGLAEEYSIQVRELFARLGAGHTLTAITDNPEDWSIYKEGEPYSENLRNRNLLSKDGGKTYWRADDPNKEVLTSVVFTKPEESK